MASAPSYITENNEALTHRCFNLIINVGGMVYRHILGNEVQYMNTTLRDFLDYYREFIDETVPYKAQLDVLFPDNKGAESADNFDITLIAYLLKTFFIKDGERLHVGNYSTEVFKKSTNFSLISWHDERTWNWSPKDRMFPWNTSVVADIVRIKEYRNMIHEIVNTKIWLSEKRFKEIWNDFSAALLNLGRAFGISNVYFEIEKTLHDPLDPKRELELTKGLRTVEEKVDKTLRIVTGETEGYVKYKDECQKTGERIENIENKLQSQAGILKAIEKSVKVKQSSPSEQRKQINQQEQDNLKECSEREMVIRANSISEDFYVKTDAYVKASTKLQQNGIVVLCGNHGEGKTTMALKLISEHSVRGYRILKTPDDWRSVKCESKKSCDVIVIDDMFGVAVVAKDELKQWQRYFGEIKDAKSKEGLRIIITVKPHILQQAKERVISKHRDFFHDEYVTTVMSKDMSIEERSNILLNHLNANDREIDQNSLNLGLTKYGDSSLMIFPIGFPQCACLFSRITVFYEQGYTFFEKPIHFIKECLQDILKEENTCTAFTILWAQPEQSLRKPEIEERNQESKLCQLLNKFGVSSPSKIIDALYSHKDGFINYHEKDEEFQFSHDVVADVVGLSVCETSIKDGTELCSSDFLMHFMTTKSSDTKHTGEKVMIKESRYGQLCQRLVQMTDTNKTVLWHDAFENDLFIRELESESERTHKIFHDACAKGVSSLVRRLLQGSVDYKRYDSDGLLPIQLAALRGQSEVVKILLDHDHEQLKLRIGEEKNKQKYKGASLLHIAVLKNYDNLLRVLLNFDADLTARDFAGKTPLLLSIGECPDEKISKCLLKRRGDQTEIADNKGTTPFIEAVTKEKADIVKMLCSHEKDINCTNKEGKTMLDIARQKGNKVIESILLQNGAKATVEMEGGEQSGITQ